MEYTQVYLKKSLCFVGTSNYMSDTLQESPMTIVSQSDCLRSYSDIIDTQICVESATSSACTVSCLVSEDHDKTVDL